MKQPGTSDDKDPSGAAKTSVGHVPQGDAMRNVDPKSSSEDHHDRDDGYGTGPQPAHASQVQESPETPPPSLEEADLDIFSKKIKCQVMKRTLDMIVQLYKQIFNLMRQLRRLCDRDKLLDLRMVGSTSRDGKLRVKIPSFVAMMKTARERRTSINRFLYTSQYGYKLRLEIFLAGHNKASGDYISVFLSIMKGNYDAILGPFQYSVVIKLINQQHQLDIAVTASSMTDRCVSSQGDDVNFTFGITHFTAHEELNGFVKDNTIFIGCEVLDLNK